MAKALLRNERGGILVFVAVGMVTTLVMAGLAIDVGRGYLLKAHLSRAADAAALSAARSLRSGQAEARQKAIAVAGANGVVDGVNTASITLTFGNNEFDEETVSVTATQATPTLLMKLIGQNVMDVKSAAVAAIPPVDIVLVLDQSGSLWRAGAWEPLQEAAREFIQHFDDDIDQMGLVSFNARAEIHFPLGHGFSGPIDGIIAAMNSESTTNTADGLLLAHQLFQTGPVRARSAKVVVFFTDGRPTAFTGEVGGRERILAAWTGSGLSGYWNTPNPISIDPINPPMNGCSWPCPWGYNQRTVFSRAEADGLTRAEEIRNDDILLYTIGLGDPFASYSELLPNPDYLRQLANEDGIYYPGQPAGKMYFAPSRNELRAVFNLVAQDLLARLTH